MPKSIATLSWVHAKVVIIQLTLLSRALASKKASKNGSDKFSLRSCRSSSVNFCFDLGYFAGFFPTHRTKAQTFRGKFRSSFRKKICSPKAYFVQSSLWRSAALTRRCDPAVGFT